MSEVIGFIWNQILIGPATNFLVALTVLLFGSFGLAMLVFTLILKGATLPLTLQQMRSSKKMQVLQPKLQEIQKKYSDPKRRSEEQMKLYKEEGVNPIGCLVPTLIQFPIWIALYQVIRITLATTPEGLIELSHRLYPWSFVQQAVPLTSHFLWLNLGLADKTLIMPILVFATMWVQQKLTMTSQTMAAGGQAAQTNQMMLWLMPLVFAYFSYTLPSGLGMYWVITNIAGIALNYYVFEWYKKPPRDIFTGAGSPLSGLFSTSLKGNARSARPARDARQGGRPEPKRAPRRDDRRDGERGKDGDNAAAHHHAPDPLVPIAASRNGNNGKQRRRGVPPPSRSRPKAPPVSPPSPRATGRLNDDPASGNGGPEMRSSDGRGD